MTAIPTTTRTAQEVVAAWAERLVDTSGRNRLISYRDTKTGSLRIAGPGPGRLVGRLLTDGSVPVEAAGADPPPPVDALAGAGEPGDVAARCTAIRRRAATVLAEKGIHTLHLICGFLRWSDPADGARTTLESPLLLVPAALEQAGRGRHRLAAADWEVVLNPALARRLRTELGFELPPAPDPDDIDDWLAGLATLVADREGWEVASVAALALLSFAKEVIYRDVTDHLEEVAGHPLVAALATGGREGEPNTAAELGETASAPDLLVLDADTSQRAAVAAATAGRSFVLFGPPGTGKSQTIANSIAELIRLGRTVLFVSEKGAALDAVHKRLAAVGLARHLLVLHDPAADRKTTIGDLRAAFEGTVASARREDTTVAALDAARARLDGYGDALLAPRGRLGWSLYRLVGEAMLSRRPLDAAGITPRFPAPVDLLEMARGEHDANLALAAALGDHWDTLLEADTNPWAAIDTIALNRQGATAILALAATAARAFDTAATCGIELAGTLGVTALADPSRLHLAQDILRLLGDRPLAVPTELLSATDLTAANLAADRLRTLTGRLTELDAAGRRAYGPGWADVDPALLDAFAAAEGCAAADRLLAGSHRPATAATATARAVALRRAGERLGEAAEAAAGLLNGLAAYSIRLDLDSARDLARLVLLAKDPTPAEERWLDPAEATRAEAAASRLETACAAEAAARTEATLFTDAVCDPAFPALCRQLDGRTRVGRLGAERTLRTELAAVAFSGRYDPALLVALPMARAYHDAHVARLAAEESGAAVLGHAYRGENTDWQEVRAGIAKARAAYQLATACPALEPLLYVATSEAVGLRPLLVGAEHLARLLADWEMETARAVGLDSALLTGLALPDAAQAVGAAGDALDALAAVLARIEATSGTVLSTVEVSRLCEHRAEFDRLSAQVERNAPGDRATLGNLYAGPATDPDVLAGALRWAGALRDTVADGGPVPAVLADVTVDVDGEEVAAAAKAWREARDELLALSVDTRLADRLADPAQAPAALEAFAVAEGDAEPWRSAATVRDDLVRLGFGPLVAALLADRIPAGLVAAAFSHALYDAAAKTVLAADRRFDQTTGEALERLRDEFAMLDRRSIRLIAPARVAAAVAERYGTRRAGYASAHALIRREDLKQRRHRHLRQLLSDPEVAGAVQAVKPCFMMSPLSVSQFLPPGVRFDVVVFDEASQVLPEDALGALYRADSLVVAGDERQLPPTSFFLAGVDDDADESADPDDDAGAFESLLAIASGTPGVDTIPLRWHYRSRHESLIAFSNRRFYADRPMVVFPAPHPARDDLGVAFHHIADGLYDRGVGATHTNLAEAESVVRLVCDHLRDRPTMSIGVVALSRQQSDLIRDLLEDTVRDAGLPVDFDDPATGLFVKNLENVQGDDRDIIVLSVGYGRDAAGRLPANFGPLSRKGGWRRLNVAITRARCRLDVVSSIRAGDIRTDAEGAAYLRDYLDYAERGLAALVESVDVGAECESPFEADVAALIRSWGYDVVPQVGVDGFRIDLAVRDPLQAGRFALGIECDGAAYHSSADARERDRLRQEVLEGLGWRIHRIWGPSWFRLRAKEEARLADVLRQHVVGFAAVVPGPAPLRRSSVRLGEPAASVSTASVPTVPPPRPEPVPKTVPPARLDKASRIPATPGPARTHAEVSAPAAPLPAQADLPVTHPSPPPVAVECTEPGGATIEAPPACPACGSHRLLDGPPYNREARRCLQCGWSHQDRGRAHR